MTFTVSGTSGLTFPDSSTMTTGQQACKAWVNFGGGTGTIRASYNVSSVTRHSTGQYTVNYTNAFADANYSAISTTTNNGSTGSLFACFNYTLYLTTSIRIICQLSTTASLQDPDFVSLAVFR